MTDDACPLGDPGCPEDHGMTPELVTPEYRDIVLLGGEGHTYVDTPLMAQEGPRHQRTNRWTVLDEQHEEYLVEPAGPIASAHWGWDRGENQPRGVWRRIYPDTEEPR